jgi:histone deacetylase complex regulatory component SIN3
MPISYPFRCSKREEFYKQFLNEKWVSVPHGSEENFNVRFKNANELNLLKS